jgi:hypothetical protein
MVVKMRSLAVAILVIPALLAVGTKSDYLTIKSKFQSIEKRKLSPGTRVVLPARELNAYVQAELPKVAPSGIRNPSVELQAGNVAVGRAMINFLKVRSANAAPPNWLMKKLLDGEHQVVVTTELNSKSGYATVNLKRVDVDGVGIQGAALDFLIRNYLMPNYPDAKIGTPFKLDYRMDRVEVAPGVAYVHIGKN